MCGLTMVAGPLGLKHKEFFAQALQCNSLRGEDSTGMFSVINKNAEVFKKAVGGADFMQMRRSKALVLGADKVLVGHNRAATVGSVIDDNAHPFVHGDITLVHNGTLRNRHNFGNYNRFDVDSEFIANALNDTDDPADVISEIDGAFALIWYNSQVNKVFLVRNDERPLVTTITKDGVLLCGSEPGLIQWVAQRNGLEFGPLNFLKSMSLLTLDLEGMTTSYRNIEKKLVVPVNTGTTGYTNYNYNKSGRATSVTYYGGALIDKGLDKLKLSDLYDDNSITKVIPVTILKREMLSVNRWKLIGHTLQAPFYEVEMWDGDDKNSSNILNENVLMRPTSVHFREETPDDSTIIGTFLSKMTPKHCTDFSAALAVSRLGEVNTNVIALTGPVGPYKDQYNRPTSRTKWKKLVRHGCSWCFQMIPDTPDEVSSMDWNEKGEPICKACIEAPFEH